MAFPPLQEHQLPHPHIQACPHIYTHLVLHNCRPPVVLLHIRNQMPWLPVLLTSSRVQICTDAVTMLHTPRTSELPILPVHQMHTNSRLRTHISRDRHSPTSRYHRQPHILHEDPTVATSIKRTSMAVRTLVLNTAVGLLIATDDTLVLHLNLTWDRRQDSTPLVLQPQCHNPCRPACLTSSHRSKGYYAFFIKFWTITHAKLYRL
jgi:hypothetical protein